MTEDKFIRLIKTLQANDFDVPICITGRERSGKSTLSIRMTKKLIKKIDLEKNIAYRTKEAQEKILAVERGGVVILDEAIRALYKMNFMKSEVKEITQLFAQIGTKNMVFFLNIPRIWDLSENIRNHRIKFWIHIIGRGHAVVFEPDRSPLVTDPWHRAENYKILKKAFFGTSMPLDKQLTMLRKTNIYFTDFKFSGLPKELEAKYRVISDKRKMETQEEENTPKSTVVENFQIMIVRAVYDLEAKGFKLYEIAKMMGKRSQDLGTLKRKFPKSELIKYK